MAVHDRLRQAGGARGVEHPQRVLERDLLEAQLGAGAELEQLAPAQAPGAGLDEARGRRSLLARTGRAPSPRAPPSAAPRGCPRRQLCGRSPCRRGGSRPPRAAPSARSGRSGRSRCARRTPAPRSTRSRRCSPRQGTRRASRGCSACRPRRGRRDVRRAHAGRPPRLRPARRARPSVILPSSRSSEACSTATVVGVPAERSKRAQQEVLGVVELGPFKPARPGHAMRAEHLLVGPRRAHAAELPDARPELLELLAPTSATARRSRRTRGRGALRPSA